MVDKIKRNVIATAMGGGRRTDLALAQVLLSVMDLEIDLYNNTKKMV